MTLETDPLDRLTARHEWADDWADVLRRAGARAPTAHPVRALTRRRLVVAFALLVCGLAPLAALGAANHWWFLGYGAPEPVHVPVVVKEGEWRGHPWQLVAYASRTDGVCYAISENGSDDEGAMSCVPVIGVARTPETKRAAEDVTISIMSGHSPRFPTFVAGPIVESAETVEIDYGDGQSMRVDTFPAPESVGRVRFFATPLDIGDVPDKLIGYDSHGNVVACLVHGHTRDGGSPLADCR